MFSKKKLIDSQKKGELLYKFRTPHCKIILAVLIPGAIIFCGVFIGFFWFILIQNKDILGFVSCLIVWLICSSTFYYGYLMAFENIIIFERGIHPPIGQDPGMINTLIGKRTFIPFSEITDCRLSVGPRLNDVITFRVQHKVWDIQMGKNTKVIASILEKGIANNHLNKTYQRSL